MLPEQILRDAPFVICLAHWRLAHVGWFARFRKHYQLTVDAQPLTLTGDDWRKAWADAHDKATDKALDAVY